MILTVTGQSKGDQFGTKDESTKSGEREGKIYLVREVVDKPKHPNPSMFAPVTSLDIKQTNSSTIFPILPSSTPSIVFLVTECTKVWPKSSLTSGRVQ